MGNENANNNTLYKLKSLGDVYDFSLYRYCGNGVGRYPDEDNTLNKLKSLGDDYDFYWYTEMDQNISNVFYQAIKLNDINTIKWLFSSAIINDDNIHNMEIYQKFSYACCNNRLTIAQWIYNLKRSRFYNPSIGQVFENACNSNQNLEVLKWLFSLEIPDIDMNFDNSFYKACQYYSLDIAKWLLTIGRVSNETFNKYIIFFDDYSIYELAFKLNYKPLNDLSFYKYESQSNADLYRNKLKQNYKKYLEKRSRYLWFVCKIVTKLLIPFLIHKKYSPNESGFRITKDHFERLVKV